MREWYITKALRSVRSLDGVIDELTEEEVLHCMELEVSAGRRRNILDRLLNKAVQINRDNYIAHLKEKFKWPVKNP